MPKDKRSCTFANKSHDCLYKPYSRGNNNNNNKRSGSNVKEETAEWDNVTCPICMESPHNAVLLLCSSHDKGCRPFMCDTSRRHSNCLDQYIKAHATEIPPVPEPVTSVEDGVVTTIKTLKELDLLCPLCRGKVRGWRVMDKIRRQHDMSRRGCAHESCHFVGTYEELRKHARCVHPFARPSEVDPARQREWRRMERQRELGDVFSSIQSAMPGATIMGDYVIEEVDDEDERDEEESEEEAFAEGNAEAQHPGVTAAQADLWTMLVLFQLPDGGPMPPQVPFVNDPLRQASGNPSTRAAASPRVGGGSRSVYNPGSGRPHLSNSNFDIRRLPEIFEGGAASRRLPEAFEGGADRRLPEAFEGGASRRLPEVFEGDVSRRFPEAFESSASSSRGLELNSGASSSNSRGSLEWNNHNASLVSLERNSNHNGSSRRSLERSNMSNGSQRGSSDRSTQSGPSLLEVDYIRRRFLGPSREEHSHDHFLRLHEQSNRSSGGERGRSESASDHFLRRHGNSAGRNSRR